jgi:hypothetical protein
MKGFQMRKVGNTLSLKATSAVLGYCKPGDPYHCLVAETLRLQRGAWSIAVKDGVVRWNEGDIETMKGTRYFGVLSAEVMLAIRDFDDTGVAKPLQFQIRDIFSKPIKARGPNDNPTRKKRKVETRKRKVASAAIAKRRYRGITVLERRIGAS